MAASINVQDKFINVKGLAISGRYWFIHLTHPKLSASFRSCWKHFVRQKLPFRTRLDFIKYEVNHDGL